MQLAGKRIILGVTGSIAAYKSILLARLLVREGAEVQVILTESARDFVTPLTFSALTGKPVLTSMISHENTWNNHVHLGLWADLFLITPLSANTLSALSEGRCENLLQAVYLSARCPVMVAPAMDHDMYLHPATQRHFEVLRSRNCILVESGSGELASGLIGQGRVEEPEMLLGRVITHFNERPRRLTGKVFLVTAGPTREPIDEVRFISNHSSGKMGVAIASALLEEGARVVLVAGPLQVNVPHGVLHVPVETADEMMKACMEYVEKVDAAVMTAAVADYKPASAATGKIKKDREEWALELTRTKDILGAMGQVKRSGQVLVGFALEAADELQNAKSKLERKNLDLIVLNSLRDPGAGFGVDTNKITLIKKDNTIQEFPLLEKAAAAGIIVQTIITLMHEE